jgi:hypothetical protein
MKSRAEGRDQEQSQTRATNLSSVMPALVAGIHACFVIKDVHGRDEPGHDAASK